MGCEIPVCRRCCFCLPLRRGLLVLAYLKVVADAYFIFAGIFFIILISDEIKHRENGDGVFTSRMLSALVTPVIQSTAFFTDFVATIGLIVGGHMKNVKLLRIFFFLSIATWMLTFLVRSIIVVSLLKYFIEEYVNWETVAVQFSISFVYLAVQTYILILLRSVIIKLRNNSEFRFKNKNNTDEAECTMTCEEEAVDMKTADC